MYSGSRKVSRRLQRTSRSLQVNRFLNLDRSHAVLPGTAISDADFEILRHFVPIRRRKGAYAFLEVLV